MWQEMLQEEGRPRQIDARNPSASSSQALQRRVEEENAPGQAQRSKEATASAMTFPRRALRKGDSAILHSKTSRPCWCKGTRDSQTQAPSAINVALQIQRTRCMEHIVSGIHEVPRHVQKITERVSKTKTPSGSTERNSDIKTVISATLKATAAEAKEGNAA